MAWQSPGRVPMKTIRRLDQRAVTPVVAEILLVAIAVVLAAVIYFMASGLLSGSGATKPYASLAETYPNAQSNMTLKVAGISLSYSYNAYKFNLAEQNITGTATYVGPSGTPVYFVIAGATYRVTYTDVSGNGQLSQGDQIVVGGNGVPLPKNVHFTFYLIWATDGSLITSNSWLT